VYISGFAQHSKHCEFQRQFARRCPYYSLLLKAKLSVRLSPPKKNCFWVHNIAAFRVAEAMCTEKPLLYAAPGGNTVGAADTPHKKKSISKYTQFSKRCDFPRRFALRHLCYMLRVQSVRLMHKKIPQNNRNRKCSTDLTCGNFSAMANPYFSTRGSYHSFFCCISRCG